MVPAFENDQKIHTDLEDALHTYPIISAPAGFSKMVMNNVRASTSIPKFQLFWVDYALAFFVTSIVSLALVFWQFVPTQWIMQVKFQAFVFWERSTRLPFAPILLAGFILALIAMLFGIILVSRPRLTISPQ